MCLETHAGPQAQGYRRRRCRSLELSRSSTRTPGSGISCSVRGAVRACALHQEGVLGPCIHGKRWAVPRVGRSERGTTYACTTPSHSRVAPLHRPKGGPGEWGNLGWPGGGLPDLDDPSFPGRTLVAGRSSSFPKASRPPIPTAVGPEARRQHTHATHAKDAVRRPLGESLSLRTVAHRAYVSARI